jgi:protein disulfide-isomerase A6
LIIDVKRSVLILMPNLSRNLAPVYEQLAEAFPSGKVVIAKTDADGVGKALGKRFAVKGYPSEYFPLLSLPGT